VATLKEIAERAHVSINAVSRALNGKNKERWPAARHRAEQIRLVARKLGYRPHAAARMMRSSSSKHLGLLTSSLQNAPYEYPVLVGLNQRLQDAGYALSVISATDLTAPDKVNALAFRENYLAGLFVMHVPLAVRKLARAIAPRHLWLDSNERRSSNCIYRDEYHAGRLATLRVLEFGHRDLLFLGLKPWPDAHLSATERTRGFEDVLRSRGLNGETLLLGLGLDELRERTDELLAHLRPGRAVIAMGHALAEWCAHAAARRGLCAGRDFALASCAEELECSQTWPWLSRVSFDRQALGRQAAEMMLALLNGKTRVPSTVIQSEWVEGETARLGDGVVSLPSAHHIEQITDEEEQS
jgi:LacI family transcriptional regulator